ncbi:hypothetical protein [Paenibacillus sp. LjRoot56]|uniref:hypothetical protein n=1 Tax=Paenibacillus sp. LjRoot56 TaxID=3342333 RepID=UPI003ECF67CE
MEEIQLIGWSRGWGSTGGWWRWGMAEHWWLVTDVTKLATDGYVLYQIAKGSSPLRELPFYL